MEQKEIVAETTVETQPTEPSKEVATPTKTETQEVVEKGTQPQTNENDNHVLEEEKKKQEEAERKKQELEAHNREQARLRREKELQEKLEKTRIDTIISVLGGVNPFTQEPMTDSVDVEKYELMKRIKEDGKDPIADYHLYATQSLKSTRTQELSKQEQIKYVEKDQSEFYAKYPNLDIPTLLKDENFKLFADGKVGNVPMTKIYEDYQKLSGFYKQEVVDRVGKTQANTSAAPQSTNPTNPPDPTLYTWEQLQNMTQAEVSANWEKVKASYDKLKSKR